MGVLFLMSEVSLYITWVCHAEHSPASAKSGSKPSTAVAPPAAPLAVSVQS